MDSNFLLSETLQVISLVATPVIILLWGSGQLLMNLKTKNSSLSDSVKQVEDKLESKTKKIEERLDLEIKTNRDFRHSHSKNVESLVLVVENLEKIFDLKLNNTDSKLDDMKKIMDNIFERMNNDK